MALKTSQEYLESVKKLTPKVYVGGKWVSDLLDHPVTRSMVMANAAIYDLAQDERHKSVMVAGSKLTANPVNRNVHVSGNNHDLDMRQEMAFLPARRLAPATTAASAATQ